MSLIPKHDVQTKKVKETTQETNPWVKIEQTVRPVEEEKVKDSTANLDALLVFAGLYSAILAAFLIESYKNLQSDPKEDLLRQIAGQTANYSFRGGYLNSTYDPSQVTPFHAAVSDVRVNVCWFASLIVSLSTASFAILVRQWLREYITIDRTAPEECMRIWYHRSQGLSDWYLIEITTLLPILLQIAFALFFVGLCFFTTAVHPSIGTTSIVCVSGWAVLFTFGILAPAVSPRCPYKTTFLKSTFAFIRAHTRSKVSAVRLPDANTHSTAGSASRPGSSDIFSDCMPAGVIEHLFKNRISKGPVVREENEIRNTDEDDLTIFANIDSLFLDNDLLLSMRDNLKRRPRPVREVVPFVATVTQTRAGILPLSTGEASRLGRGRPWPWALSHGMRAALVEMVADSMLHEFPRILFGQWEVPAGAVVDQYRTWTDALILIMALASPEHDVVPEIVVRILKQLLEDCRWDSSRIFVDSMGETFNRDGDCAAHCLSCMAYALKALQPGAAVERLEWIVNDGFLGQEANDPFVSLLECVENPVPGAITLAPRDILVFLDIACIILHNFCEEQKSAGEDDILIYVFRIHRLLRFVFEMIPKMKIWLPDMDFLRSHIPAAEGIGGLYDVLQHLFMSPRFTYIFLNFLFSHFQYLSPDRALVLLFSDFIGTSYVVENTTAISILNICANFFEDHTGAHAMTLLPILRLCDLIYSFRTSNDPDVLNAWHRLFRNVVTCIDAAVVPLGGVCENCEYQYGHTDFCRAAMRTLVTQDDGGDTRNFTCLSTRALYTSVEEEEFNYLEWRNKFDPNEARIPDAMVNKLRRLVCTTNGRHGRKFWRVRRLEDLEKARDEYIACSPHAASGSASMAPASTAVFSKARRRAKSLFESFNSDFGTASAPHWDSLAPQDVHIPHFDSVAVGEARPDAPPTETTAAGSTLSSEACR
ncbi:hypothetical protein NM688_g5129 [Phlebia brevispora]|uniref:Uncharacterized protein n=1 Tax=Phlebia brevispora TaxID=194682 RepID=A0ACC1T080_9APHY|nr:hypothetical protein NM688_g5129 [Phlebia brevispora]